jgi:hypothetical protein
MQLSKIVSPDGVERPWGYTPMSAAIEIMIGPNGQIGDAEVVADTTTRKRYWLPDLPRTSGIAPILGSDKLDYYHPTRKPKAYVAMLELLEQSGIIELKWVADWMRSDCPIALSQQWAEQSKAVQDSIEGGRIVWRLADGSYIHELQAVKDMVHQQTLERVIAGSGGALMGVLPKVHNRQLAAPLYGCNNEMFKSWGRLESAPMEIDAIEALTATRRYTEMLSTPGHHLRIGDKYWVWGALPELAASGADKAIASFFSLDNLTGQDPVQIIKDLIARVTAGAKSIKAPPENLKIACGYVGLGGSGVGRVAIGQMTETSVMELLHNLGKYHADQLRYLSISKPFWTFGGLTVAEGSSKAAIAKANQQIFAAMIGGKSPPQVVTTAVLRRMQVEGVPNMRGKKSNRQWSQLAYLAWIAPTFNPDTMKPDTTLDNLLAWHTGRVFANCQYLAYKYAARSKNPGNDWRNPIDNYRQRMFSAPAQCLPQVLAKISGYLGALRDKQYWHKKLMTEMGDDCPGMAPPDRWTSSQAYFFALGMSDLGSDNNDNSNTTEENGND